MCTSLYCYCLALIIENMFMLYANNKGTDQPAHQCTLISTFVVHPLDSKIPILAKSNISRLWLLALSMPEGHFCPLHMF